MITSKNVFTVAQQNFIEENYEKYGNEELAKMINLEFDINIKPSQIRAYLYNRGMNRAGGNTKSVKDDLKKEVRTIYKRLLQRGRNPEAAAKIVQQMLQEEMRKYAEVERLERM